MYITTYSDSRSLCLLNIFRCHCIFVQTRTFFFTNIHILHLDILLKYLSGVNSYIYTLYIPINVTPLYTCDAYFLTISISVCYCCLYYGPVAPRTNCYSIDRVINQQIIPDLIFYDKALE